MPRPYHHDYTITTTFPTTPATTFPTTRAPGLHSSPLLSTEAQLSSTGLEGGVCGASRAPAPSSGSPCSPPRWISATCSPKHSSPSSSSSFSSFSCDDQNPSPIHCFPSPSSFSCSSSSPPAHYHCHCWTLSSSFCFSCFSSCHDCGYKFRPNPSGNPWK